MPLLYHHYHSNISHHNTYIKFIFPYLIFYCSPIFSHYPFYILCSKSMAKCILFSCY